MTCDNQKVFREFVKYLVYQKIILNHAIYLILSTSELLPIINEMSKYILFFVFHLTI